MGESVVLLLHDVLLLLGLSLVDHPDIALLLLDRLDNGSDRGGRRHMGWAIGGRRTVLNNNSGGLVHYRLDSCLVNVLHVRLQVRSLLELLGAECTLVLALDNPTVAVNTKHVPSQAALALELLEADVAVVPGALMLGLDMHISAPC